MCFMLNNAFSFFTFPFFFSLSICGVAFTTTGVWHSCREDLYVFA